MCHNVIFYCEHVTARTLSILNSLSEQGVGFLRNLFKQKLQIISPGRHHFFAPISEAGDSANAHSSSLVVNTLANNNRAEIRGVQTFW